MKSRLCKNPRWDFYSSLRAHWLSASAFSQYCHVLFFYFQAWLALRL